MASEKSGIPIAQYLWPEEKVVPFRPRPELDELLSWCANGGRAAIRLVAGEGGSGKTRLALQLGEKTAGNGWQLLWVPRGAEREGVRAVRDLGRPCVLVVDYAETRSELVYLVNDVAAGEHSPYLRVLLLARSVGEWWRQLLADVEKRTAALLKAALPVTIGSVSVTGGPQEVFAEALTAFARKLGVERPDATLPLTDPDPVMLVVHAAALLTVLDHSTKGRPRSKTLSGAEALEGLLGHEARYWVRAADGRGLKLDLSVLRFAVAVACLVGADSEASAAKLLSRIPDLDSAERRGQVARWLRDLYPAARSGELEVSHGESAVREWIGPLRPDVVAEHLVVDELSDRPGMLPQLFTGISEYRASRALTVLARAVDTQPRALDLLRGALRADLEHLAIPALSVAVETNPVLGSLLSEALESQQISTATLERIADTARYPSVALAAPAAIVCQRLADNSATEEERAWRLADLSNWLGDLGRPEAALATIEESTSLFRQLSDVDGDAFRPRLAASLSNESVCLSRLRRWQEALDKLDEAAGIYVQLAESGTEAFLPYLAVSLNNQSGILAALGRREEALAKVEQSVALYRQLAETAPDEFHPTLATTLHNEASKLAAVGRLEEALAAVEQAVAIRRQLTGALPDAFLPNLAESLNDQSEYLAALGRNEEALAAVGQAVAIRRRLTKTRPDAFVPGLAESLNAQARRRGDLGRWQEALAAIEEAVSLYRSLTNARPMLYSKNLTHSLDVLASIYSVLNSNERAESARAEAESIRLTSEQKELIHTGLLLTAAYLRDDSAEQARLLESFRSELSRLADAFTAAALFAVDVIATVQGKSFYEALHSIDEHTEVLLLPSLPVGPWDEALLLTNALKVGGDNEARRTPLTMNIPSAINVTFRLAISAITQLTGLPEFSHMTLLTVNQALIDAIDKRHDG